MTRLTLELLSSQRYHLGLGCRSRCLARSRNHMEMELESTNVLMLQCIVIVNFGFNIIYPDANLTSISFFLGTTIGFGLPLATAQSQWSSW